MLVAVVAVAVGAVVPSVAWANPWGSVNCDQLPSHPECEVQAGDPGDEGGSRNVEAASDGEVVCRDGDGEVVDCFVEGEGWLWSDGCRYLPVEAAPPSGVNEPGAAYRPTCPGDPEGSQRPVVWIADSEAPAPGPAELGRVAVSRLVLPSPEIAVSPASVTLVGLPTWLWIEPGWWRTRSASARVPEVTVTAVATPVRVQWDTGDGGRQSCDGPGTPYTSEWDPAAASPDCGWVYEQPGTVQLRAEVTWQVSWSGGGMSGDAGPVTSVGTASMQVRTSQSVNVGTVR